jgi:hypothetical protein
LPDELLIRPPRQDEASEVAQLLYLTSPGGFALFGGSPQGGLRVLEASYRRPGTDASREVLTVAELDGQLAGVMAAFAVSEGDRRRQRFMRVALRQRAPWHWLGIW